jgi:hypothetical protein
MEGRGSGGGPVPHAPDSIGRETPLVSCFWCERLHRGAHPLSVCPPCAERFSTLRSLEMSGSYPLSDAAIDATLTRIAPGNYALGYLDGETFSVFYVGRSDSDLKRRLHEWVGIPTGDGFCGPSGRAAWAVHQRGTLPVDAPMLGRVGRGDGGYTRFAYCYAQSAEEAYAREWRNYDAFGGRYGLDNESQPARPHAEERAALALRTGCRLRRESIPGTRAARPRRRPPAVPALPPIDPVSLGSTPAPPTPR